MTQTMNKALVVQPNAEASVEPVIMTVNGFSKSTHVIKKSGMVIPNSLTFTGIIPAFHRYVKGLGYYEGCTDDINENSWPKIGDTVEILKYKITKDPKFHGKESVVVLSWKKVDKPQIVKHFGKKKSATSADELQARLAKIQAQTIEVKPVEKVDKVENKPVDAVTNQASKIDKLVSESIPLEEDIDYDDLEEDEALIEQYADEDDEFHPMSKPNWR